MNHVIESIGKWGVKTSPIQPRLLVVRPGDIIQVPDSLRQHPSQHEFSRIATIANGVAHVCEDMGSAFLNQDGSCDISGGPWWSVPTCLLKPTGMVRQASYWNWGDNGAGANQGVHYTISRPVHELTVRLCDLQFRYASSEQEARDDTTFRNERLPREQWSLVHTGDDGSTKTFVFRKIV